MMLNYSVTYLFAIVFLGILYLNTVDNFAQTSENRCFRLLILATICTLAAEMGAWLIDGKTFAGANLIAWIVNIGAYLFSGLVSIIWFVYTGKKLHINQDIKRGQWLLICAPLLIEIALSLLSPWTRVMFYMDEQNVYIRGPLFILQIIVTYGYLVTASVRVVLHMRKDMLRQQRKECAYLVLFSALPSLGGILQITVYGLSLTWLCAALSIMMVYVNIQNQRISLDALTGLNNRGQFDKYLHDRFANADTKTSFALFMLDIDNFKHINDQYGHVAGDKALINASEILKKAILGTNSFLARYGGDEFAVVVNYKKPSEADAVYQAIDSETHLFNTVNDNLPYQLHFSIGCVRSDEKNYMNYLNMIRAADTRMYAQKQLNKAPKG